MALVRIDRIDERGQIREHTIDDSDWLHTLCGIEIRQSQIACGNRRCTKCEALERARAKQVES